MSHTDTLTRHGTFVKKTISSDGTKEIRVEMPFGIGDVDWWPRFQRSVPEHLLVDWSLADAITIIYEEKYRDPFCEYLGYNFSDPYDAPFVASFHLQRREAAFGDDVHIVHHRFRAVIHTLNHQKSRLRDSLRYQILTEAVKEMKEWREAGML